MQIKDIKNTFKNLHDPENSKISINVNLHHWEETIVAAYAKDERLQTILEQADNYGERIASLCIFKSIHQFDDIKEKLGNILAYGGCLGLGKRWLTRNLNIPVIKAQELLNGFYAIFHETNKWIKEFGKEEARRFVKSKIENIIKQSLLRCVKNLPQDWIHASDLTFIIPAYAYDIQAIKFFKHYFETEIVIEEKMIKLGVVVQFLS